MAAVPGCRSTPTPRAAARRCASASPSATRRWRPRCAGSPSYLPASRRWSSRRPWAAPALRTAGPRAPRFQATGEERCSFPRLRRRPSAAFRVQAGSPTVQIAPTPSFVIEGERAARGAGRRDHRVLHDARADRPGSADRWRAAPARTSSTTSWRAGWLRPGEPRAEGHPPPGERHARRAARRRPGAAPGPVLVEDVRVARPTRRGR